MFNVWCECILYFGRVQSDDSWKVRRNLSADVSLYKRPTRTRPLLDTLEYRFRIGTWSTTLTSRQVFLLNERNQSTKSNGRVSQVNQRDVVEQIQDHLHKLQGKWFQTAKILIRSASSLSLESLVCLNLFPSQKTLNDRPIETVMHLICHHHCTLEKSWELWGVSCSCSSHQSKVSLESRICGDYEPVIARALVRVILQFHRFKDHGCSSTPFAILHFSNVWFRY